MIPLPFKLLIKKFFNDFSVYNLFSLIILALLFLTSNNFSQTEIVVIGNKFFTQEDYKNWINPKNLKNISQTTIDTIKTRIESNLKNEAFYFPIFKNFEIDSSKRQIIITIDEGLPSVVKNIYFKMNFDDSTQIKKFFDFLINENFFENYLQEAINKSITYLETNGFPFAKVTIENISFEQQDNFYSTSILISVEPNIKCYINKINIDGNTKTKDYVITRAIGIKENQLYNQNEVDNIKIKLNKLRFFENIDDPFFYLNSNNKGILKLSLKEKETNSFDGIIGYVPASTNDKGYFTGFLNLSFENLFGTGRLFKFRWQQLNKLSQDLELKYLEPWIFQYPFNIQFGLVQRKQDSTFIQRNFETNLEYISQNDFSVSLLLNSQSTISLNQNLNSLFNSSSLSIGFAFKNDTRDDVYSPTSGILFNGVYKYSSKNFSNYIINKASLQKIEFDISIYKEIFSKQVMAFSLHAKELKGNLADLSDFYYLGGTYSLRGYREKQFFGNRILWNNFEYRFLFSKYSFGYLFFDTGYYQLNENKNFSINAQKDFKIGYGFGLNIETGVGILGVSFALGKGDSFTDGKIHFGIISEF